MIKAFFISVTGGALLLFLLACNQMENSSVISLFVDVTEQTDQRPGIDEIMPLFDFDSDKWQGDYFRFSEITDIGLMSVQRVSLGYENPILSNELERNRKIQDFKAEVKNILNASGRDSAGRANSSIFLPLVSELKVLSRHPFKNRLLIVYSDLMENSHIISLYDPKAFRRLQDDPAGIQVLLENHASIPNLQGIKVIFVYSPQTAQDDQRYQIISNLYRKMMEEHGAQVEITASL